MDPFIRIRGARQHNLKNIDVDLPRRALTVITGPSGSGKSSLALDTLFAEGQRRYIESLSTYAKQFLDRMEKPDVDRVEGVAPAVAIEQKNPTKTSRSTVGTATEIHDYLRLLWARVGRTHCPKCDREIRPDSVTSVTERLVAEYEGEPIQITFPLRFSARVTHKQVVDNLRAMGFVRVVAEGQLRDLAVSEAEDAAKLGIDLTAAKSVLVVVDRLRVSADERDRIADSLGIAFVEGEGEVAVLIGKGEDAPRLDFTEHFRCPDHPKVEFLDVRPQLFSFNNPYGSCSLCTGFGATLEYDLNLIIPNSSRSIADGAVDPWTKPRYHKEREKLWRYADKRGVPTGAPWAKLPEVFRNEVLYGGEGFQGIVPFLVSREKKRYKQYIRIFLRQYQSPKVCASCKGAKLRKEALYTRVGERTVAEAGELPLTELLDWIDHLQLSPMESQIAETIIRELRARLSFVVEVGLGYLTLSRQTRTLSGGEAQRINLANSLGSSLVDTLYVLDEPTVGLHPRDTDSLLALLAKLRDAGNTVVMVEHDVAAIRSADHIIELGPASGEDGGEVVFEGEPSSLSSADTVTGRYLSGREPIAVPERRRSNGRYLELRGGRLHNLDGVDVDIPLGALTVVTGVSGSGKSTLVHDILYRGLEGSLGGGETSAKEYLGEEIGTYETLRGTTHLSDVVLVDQSPIGRTPRSNPVTYIKAWDEVRRIFAAQPAARQRNLNAGHFSFNAKGGRCEACKGAGHIEVEMVFMADVYVPCELCKGRRYKAKTLEVEYKGRTVAGVLEMTVDEAIRFFIKEGKLGRALWQLQKVGLGYLRLGQPANTLSGGESQRLKIARELSGSAGKKGRKIYLLDEPTTGLSGEDVRKLVRVLEQLVEAGHTVVVIEHNLDLIKVADWVIDMGPGAGREGGQVVVMGSPEDVARTPESITGRYLREVV